MCIRDSKYVVRFPDTNQPDELRIAELPPEVLAKSKAAPGLVADVIVSKLVDHLPLYRQEQRYARQGFPIARSTLCGWLAEAAEGLTPLWQVHKERVLSADIVNTDDTPVPVQDPDRDHCRTGRIWVYVSQHGTVYDATEDRSRDGPLAFLQGVRTVNCLLALGDSLGGFPSRSTAWRESREIRHWNGRGGSGWRGGRRAG